MSFSDAFLDAVDAELTSKRQTEAKIMMAINAAAMSSAYIDSLLMRLNELSTTVFHAFPSLNECLPKALSELRQEVNLVHETGVKELYEPVFVDLYNQLDASTGTKHTIVVSLSKSKSISIYLSLYLSI